MSIILGPYDNQGGGSSTSDQRDSTDDEELFVFGYACKLFHDDDKAILENSGQMLIPWMGDGSLMVDRYDIRNRLEDKGQFGLKPTLPRRRAEEEEELEDRLDKERYLALGVDILEHELLEEEKAKRGRERSGSYQAVGFTYNDSIPAERATPTTAPPIPPRPEHPPTSTVDIAESDDDRFVVPAGLVIPPHIRQPVTKKVHAIIERTAGFVAHQGTQMEIIIKAKQKYNPLFSFVSISDPLYSYYRHLLQHIASGHYTPERGRSSVVEGGGEGGMGAESGVSVEEPSEVPTKGAESDSEDSDEEGFELHPLLRISTTPRSSPKPPSTKNLSGPPITSALPSTTTTVASSHTHSPTPSTSQSSFYTKSLTVNAAPSLDQGGQVGRTSDCGGGYPHPSLASQQTAPDGQPYQPSHHHTHHEGYSLHPQPSDYSSQQSLEAYYHRLRADHISNQTETVASFHLHPGHNPGPPPPPPDLQPIIDKTAEYVARNSEEFERTVLEKHCGDPKFGFLNPWDKYYPYYKLRLQLNKERAAEEALAVIERDLQRMQREATQRGEMIQKLSESGTVSFRLQPKKVTRTLDVGVASLTPDMEEEEEEEGEKEEQNDRESCDGGTVSYSRESYSSMQDGYTAEQDSGQVTYNENDYQTHSTNDLQSSLSDHAHYSAEGLYYCPSSNGEVGGETGEELPAAKRAKTDKNITIMDNKVQEFLSQVKAVLDT